MPSLENIAAARSRSRFHLAPQTSPGSLSKQTLWRGARRERVLPGSAPATPRPCAAARGRTRRQSHGDAFHWYGPHQKHRTMAARGLGGLENSGLGMEVFKETACVLVRERKRHIQYDLFSYL